MTHLSRPPFHPGGLLGALALAALLQSCMVLEHMLDPRPPGAPNIELEDGMVWKQKDPMDINGIWIDAEGTRLRLDLTQGIGQVYVESEDAKFFWDHGEMLVKADRVQVKRLLGGDKVDSDVGQLTFAGSEGAAVLVIEFNDLGTWQREQPVPLQAAWVQGQAPLTLTHGEGDTYSLQGDAALGWISAYGWIRGAEASFDVLYADGAKQTVPAKLTVGLPWIHSDLEALLPKD